MGSNSSSSNTSTTDNRVFDNRQAADNGAMIARAEGGDVTIYNTAEEAVALGTTFAQAASEMAESGFLSAETLGVAALDTGGKLAVSALDFADKANYDAKQLAGATLNTLSATTSEAIAEAREDSVQLTSDLIRIGLPAVAAIIIFTAVYGRN